MRVFEFVVVVVVVVVGVVCGEECEVEGTHPPLQTVPNTTTCVNGHCVTRFVYQSSYLSVVRVVPNSGPMSGGTEVVVEGEGIRDFGQLMKCRFGDDVVGEVSILTDPGDINPFHNKRAVCVSPPQGGDSEALLEISLTGETFTNSSVTFTYYPTPAIVSVTPPTTHTRGGETITIQGSGFNGVNSSQVSYTPTCRFTVQTRNGLAHSPVTAVVEGTVTTDTEMKCIIPATHTTGTMNVSISLNAVDYTETELQITILDNYHTPAFDGTAPKPRESFVLAPLSNLPGFLLFGGHNGYFLNDVHLLHTDVFSSYGSRDGGGGRDLGWLDLTPNSTATGIRPAARAQHAGAVLLNEVFIYGGITDSYSQPSDELFKINLLTGGDEYTVSFSSVGDPAAGPGPRARHTLTAVDSTNQLVLFGGRSLSDCGFINRCYFNHNDTWTFTTTTTTWSQVATTGSAVNPLAGHSAVLSSHSGNDILYIFGGEERNEEITIHTFPYTGGLVLTNNLIALAIDTMSLSLITATNSAPAARQSHASCALNSGRHVVIFGGVGVAHLPLNDLWLFDTVTSEWSSHSSLLGTPIERYGHVMLGLDHELALIFGGTALSPVYLNDLHILDVHGNTTLV